MTYQRSKAAIEHRNENHLKKCALGFPSKNREKSRTISNRSDYTLLYYESKQSRV